MSCEDQHLIINLCSHCRWRLPDMLQTKEKKELVWELYTLVLKWVDFCVWGESLYCVKTSYSVFTYICPLKTVWKQNDCICGEEGEGRKEEGRTWCLHSGPPRRRMFLLFSDVGFPRRSEIPPHFSVLLRPRNYRSVSVG